MTLNWMRAKNVVGTGVVVRARDEAGTNRAVRAKGPVVTFS